MINDGVLENLKKLISKADVSALDIVLSEYNADEISSAMPFSDETIFMHACENGTEEVVQCFIKHGVYSYGIGNCATEVKSAASNVKHAAKILPIIIELVGTGMIHDNGDEFGEYAEFGEVYTPMEILENRGDKEAVEVLKSYM